jgi:hypothetical protein
LRRCRISTSASQRKNSSASPSSPPGGVSRDSTVATCCRGRGLGTGQNHHLGLHRAGNGPRRLLRPAWLSHVHRLHAASHALRALVVVPIRPLVGQQQDVGPLHMGEGRRITGAHMGQGRHLRRSELNDILRPGSWQGDIPPTAGHGWVVMCIPLACQGHFSCSRLNPRRIYGGQDSVSYIVSNGLRTPFPPWFSTCV